jgi:hypothetical protein
MNPNWRSHKANVSIQKDFLPFFPPAPFCLEVLSIGLLLFWFTSKQKTGKAVVALAGVLLFLFSSPYFSTLPLTPLERRYPPLFITPRGPVAAGLRAVKFIVVLGSGFASDASRPVELQLDDGSVKIFLGIIKGVARRHVFEEVHVVANRHPLFLPTVGAENLRSLTHVRQYFSAVQCGSLVQSMKFISEIEEE